MKEQFWTTPKLSSKGIKQLNIANQIIEFYLQQGYRLTLRQLYYQMVARGLIPNQDKEYSKLSNILVKGRMGGLVDWNAIEDRTRKPYIPYWVEGIEDAIEDTIRHYRLDRQNGQETYIEVWVEKDALSNVLRRVTEHYHIRLMVNRGYSSCSAMYDSFKRFLIKEQKKRYILYIGDHDPSGLDMLRDIKDRLAEFWLYNTEIVPVALTMQQIQIHNPPPNPAKITDPRARWYIQEFGETSYEVDALEPAVLHKTVQDSIESLIDMNQFDTMVEQEKKDTETLRKMIKRKV